MASDNKADASSDAKEHPDLIGKQLGDFKIHKLLGQGGMGEVYLAEQVSLKRRVALKILRRDMVKDEKYLRRFEAEAKAVAPISHPNIVSVISIGEAEGIHYIALEYVQGMNLRDYVDRKGPLDQSTCRFIMRKVAEALQRAGDEGIVHRDIKPENVLVTRKNEVKVADFGLARQVTGDKVDLTQTGVTMGTPLYMSPEQVEGKALDPRSDIYSFGIMCYYMMTGKPPFRGETAMAVAIQHVKGTPEPLSLLRPDLPQELIAIVEKMMAKSPDQRYQTAKEIIRDLNRMRSRNASPTETAIAIAVDDDTDTPQEVVVTQSGKQRTVLSETLTALSGVLVSAKYRKWVVAAGMIIALTSGGALAWSRREPAIVKAGEMNASRMQAPSISGIGKRMDGWVQLRWVRNVLPDEQREAGLWAVIEQHPGDEIATIDAARDLVQKYLSERNYELAKMVATVLIGQDEENGKYTLWCPLSRQPVTIDQKVEMNGARFYSPAAKQEVIYEERTKNEQIFGYLFKGIVLSRQQQPEKSNESFIDMFAVDKRTELRSEHLKWLAREYFLALNANYEMLGREPDKEMTQRFWESFHTRGGFGRPSRG